MAKGAGQELDIQGKFEYQSKGATKYKDGELSLINCVQPSPTSNKGLVNKAQISVAILIAAPLATLSAAARAESTAQIEKAHDDMAASDLTTIHQDNEVLGALTPTGALPTKVE